MAERNRDIREGKEVVFADGKKRTIYPLTIRQLRKFMKVAKKLNFEDSQDLSDEDFGNMVEAASIALEKADSEIAADKDALEDVLDMRSFNELLAGAMGADPNA